MRVLIATDSFKGSMTSLQAGEAVARGLADGLGDAEFDVVAVADGGEGTVDAFHQAAGGERVTVECRGPLGDLVSATITLRQECDRDVLGER